MTKAERVPNSSLSRREVLNVTSAATVAAAVALAPLPASADCPADDGHEPLVILEARLMETAAQSWAATQAREDAVRRRADPATLEAVELHQDMITARWFALLDQMTSLEPLTLDGVAVCVRRMLEGYAGGETGQEINFALRALEALSRLTGRPQEVPLIPGTAATLAQLLTEDAA